VRRGFGKSFSERKPKRSLPYQITTTHEEIVPWALKKKGPSQKRGKIPLGKNLRGLFFNHRTKEPGEGNRTNLLQKQGGVKKRFPQKKGKSLVLKEKKEKYKGGGKTLCKNLFENRERKGDPKILCETLGGKKKKARRRNLLNPLYERKNPFPF